MKKVLVLIIYMFGISNAYTQEVSDARTQVIPCDACTQVLIKAVEKSALTIDSLQKQVIKPLNDSIVKLRSAHSIEVTRLNEQLNASEIERNELIIKNKSLESTIAELNVNQIKVERDSLQAKYNSQLVRLKELENLISTKDKQIEQEKELCLLKSVQEKGKAKS